LKRKMKNMPRARGTETRNEKVETSSTGNEVWDTL